jgi:hypothetical protein
MPLKSGSSKQTVGKNVGELMHAYKNKGKIGASRPASKKAAQKQAVAIALSKAGKAKMQKESFDATVNQFLTKYTFQNIVTEDEADHCKYAIEGCDCSGCDECKKNQE